MPLFGMTAYADAGKFALMADLARVPKPGGCFLASDWLSATDQHSEVTGAWIADAGLAQELQQLLTAVQTLRLCRAEREYPLNETGVPRCSGCA
jgi:hypothetical protein